MTNLKNAGNYISREVTIDTVMGILNRLIGDQRKLYQARSNKNYYFLEIEPKVRFEDKPEYINNEVTYIRNITGSTEQNSYTGMIKVNDPIFSSDYSLQFWSVLAMDFDELCYFILNGGFFERTIELNPLVIIERLIELNKLKAVPNEKEVLEAYTVLVTKFEKFKGVNAKGEIIPISFYCSALYLQLERLENRYNLSSARTKSGGISGISKNGFTQKDFMNRYTTGDKKKIWGNPYIREDFVEGAGRSKKLLKKVGGKLEVNIDIERSKALEIRNLIDHAGVSSFYLGKKGLAYVSDIRI
jgi:hypothetical protein